MSTITLTDDDGNTQDVTLPDSVTLTIAADTPPPNDPPPVNDPPPPPPPDDTPSSVVAACEVVIDGQTVTFTDKTVSARSLVSVTVGYGLGGTAKEIGAGGSATKDYPKPDTFNAALTATDDKGVKSTVLFRVVVPGSSDNTYTAGTPAAPPSGGTGGGGGGGGTGGSTTPPPAADPAQTALPPKTVAGTDVVVTLRLAAVSRQVTAYYATADHTGIAKSAIIDWGDGSTPDTGPGLTGFPTHVYAQDGTYPVTVTVTSGSGAVQAVTQSVTVVGLAEPPAPQAIDGAATLTATLIDGTQVAISAKPGQRVPFVAGRLVGSLMYHADGKSVCIENMYAGLSGNTPGWFKLCVNGAIVFDGLLLIWAYARTRPFWIVQPEVNPAADLSMFPNFGPAPSASMAAAYAAADNSPMGIGLCTWAFGNPGERPDLCPSPPNWDCCQLTNPCAANAAVVLGMSGASCPWGFHAIDPATGLMLDVTQYPKATFQDTQLGANGNPIGKYGSGSPYLLEGAQMHATLFCAVAAAVFGTDYHKEELALWANYVFSLWQNPASRIAGGSCGGRGIPRAIGRGLAVASYASLLSDHPDYFAAWVRDALQDLTTLYLPQEGIQIIQKSYGYAHNGYGPWQEHIKAHGIAVTLAHGYSEGQQVFDYFMTSILDSLLVTPHEFATIYNSCWGDANGNVAADWAEGLADAAVYNKKLAAAMPLAEGSTELQCALLGVATLPTGSQAGDFSGYPTSPSGYLAIMQPCIAYAVDHATDKTRAQAAWDKVAQWGIPRIDYSQSPRYFILPRAA